MSINPTITIDSIGNIYAAGWITNGNGKQYVAKWNGTSWMELGGINNSAFNSLIFNLITDAKGNLYASGNFNNNNNKRFVAKWNGENWLELGGVNISTFDSTIWAITTDSIGNVYIGGDFTIPNVSYTSNYVAKYSNPNLTPLILINFSAKATESNVIRSNWQTATETNSSNFIVERSNYGNQFKDIGTVTAIGSGANEYQFIDYSPNNGSNYYRLKILDKDGSFSYSKVVSIQLPIFNNKFSIFPNPSKNFAIISFSKTVYKATLAVYDITGKVVISQPLNGSNSYKLNTQSLTNGKYVIKVTTTTGDYSEKVLINK